MRQTTTAFAVALLIAGHQAHAVPWIEEYGNNNIVVAQGDNSQHCEGLLSIKLPDTTITSAQVVTAGAFKLPGPTVGPTAPASVYASLPAFCRVTATIKPSSDSDIKMEVWLPTSGWNGKYLGVGNGAWSGVIAYPSLGRSLSRGYATASTDTGHTGGMDSASFAVGHPEKVVDFGYRAVHEMTVRAKAVIAVFYGDSPRHSYWNACSSGGKQGLKEAQRYPGDYNGIIAGAPANNWTRQMAGMVWSAQAARADNDKNIPKEKYLLLHQAVLAACDTLDGVSDGVLEDPTRCSFDPKVLQCKGEDAADCLTAAQLAAVQKIYAGPVNPRTREQVFPGLERGSESRWETLGAGGPGFFTVGETHFQNIVFQDMKWDFRKLNFDADIARADKADNNVMTATDPNLKDFAARGGKLIMYHGWTDAVIAPRNSVNYYTSAVKELGGAEKASNSIRLFMAPGMDHCSGGDGPNEFDTLSLLEQWVEQGKAPDKLIASQRKDGKLTRTRPLCPYPQVAQYTGTGSTDDAASFACKAP